MNRLLKHILPGIVAFGFVAGISAWAFDRSATEILKAYDELKQPSFDSSRREDQGYIQKYIEERQAYQAKQAELALELYKVDPSNARTPMLMSMRWQVLAMQQKGDEALQEIEPILAHSANEKLKIEAAFASARIKLAKSNRNNPDLSGVDAFARLAPKDERAAGLLYSANYMVKDEKKKAEIEDRLLKDYPETMYAGMIKGARRQREQLGKPFELEFTDAVKGSTVSMKGLRGKVVVIDFWATWCGPCVAEMPRMKELYAKYHKEGVEFIGVSLDQPKDAGGLNALLKFVKEKNVEWPQYYQGHGWESDFSKNWGINAIPAMFVVDSEGNLASVDARDQLETLIPELLKKAKGAGAGGQ